MANVFLRVYTREIESMIEGGQLDEAVAHCQYILKTFPMHVETYRLLGKAFLEARRYADAADIFQRVLMVVPDDFVSHVGMSIVRDDENKMDDAIWHMERAFEVQPSNSAIQGELRRLYGRRDGVEPSKIRLNRDALANMYSQGGLFNQAIAEIRSVLADDSNRPDLQVMLARAYYRSGQKVEAAEMAASLLKKYPYNMDSLRVLVDVLPGTARAENTQVYRQRLHNLDPYSSFTDNSAFASDKVVDSAVSLERLDYRPGPASGSSQSDWASSIGIKLNEAKHADTPPAWMQTEETPAQLPASASAPSSSAAAPVTAVGADSVPEWMRSAGWQESNNAAQAGSNGSGEPLSDEPIAKADIPDWLKSMAPTDAIEEGNQVPEEPAETLSLGEDGIPNWLKPTDSTDAADKTNLDVQPPSEPHPASTADVPDWLKDIAPEGTVGEVNTQSQKSAGVQDESAEPQPAGVPAGLDETPDWLKTMAPSEAFDVAPVEGSEQTVDTQPMAVKPKPATVDETPDWLKSMAPAEQINDAPVEASEQTVDTQPMAVKPKTAELEETPDQLESMAPADAINEAPVEVSDQPGQAQTAPAESQPANIDETPDWLKPLVSSQTPDEVQAKAPIQPVEPQQAPVATQPVNMEDVLKSLATAETVGEEDAVASIQPVEPQPAPVVTQPVNMEEVLKSLVNAEPAREERKDAPIQPVEPQPAPVESQTANVDETPDWLKPLVSSQTTDEEQAKAPIQPVEPQAAPATALPVNEADEVPDWLKSLASAETAGVEPAEAPIQPVEPQPAPVDAQIVNTEDVPDWLKSTTSVDADEEVRADAVESQPVLGEPQPIAQPMKEDHVPDWFKSLTGTEVVGEAHETGQQPVESVQGPLESQQSSQDDVLDWLKSLDSSETATGTPTQAQSPIEPTPASAGGVPDWFKTLTPGKTFDESPSEIPQSPVEPQPVGVDATPDWLKLLTPITDSGEGHIEATQPSVEQQPESADEIPDWLKSLAPADNVGVPNSVSEQASVDTDSLKEPETESMSSDETSPAKADAFPDRLTSVGTRAEAAALTSEAMEHEQTANNQPPVSETPVAPEPAAQAPAKPSVLPASTGPEAFHPTGEVKPLNIGDDAFSWLESLAAKHGAKPEELLTNPEDRSDEMPDWLRQSVEKAADTPVPPALAQEPVHTPAETLPLEFLYRVDAVPSSKPALPSDEELPVKDEITIPVPPAETTAQPANPPVGGDDNTTAWLEHGAADQEVKPKDSLLAPVVDNVIPPERIQNVQENHPASTVPEEIIPAVPEPAPAQDDISITSWLSKVNVKEALEKKTTEIPAQATPATQSSNDLPDWLKDLEKPVAPVEAPKADNELPEWLRHPISSDALEPVSPAPASNSTLEPELPGWVDENASLSGQAVPTMPEEWLPAETRAEDISASTEPAPVENPLVEPTPYSDTIPFAESVPIPAPSPVRLPTLKQTGMLSHIPVLDKDAELLNDAQNILDQNSLDDAMKKYTKLIKKGRLLDEVIHDLREAIYRYPVDVIIWQTLGDAYMRANRLQDALDAYTKAEELLR